MKADIILAGVGGQGVLSVAAILAEAAQREGLTVKQAEVHGMAQRGGAVQASLRIATGPIASDLISLGGADLILGMEPVEVDPVGNHLDRWQTQQSGIFGAHDDDPAVAFHRIPLESAPAPPIPPA